MSDPKIIVALDYPDAKPALQLADQLDPHQCRLKVGKELFTRSGPDVVKALQQRGFQIFLDLKYHDIPHTVAKACTAAADLGVWMVNVHTLGGSAMMRAAREALGDRADAPLLIGVTLLTSMDQHTFTEIGLGGSIESTVLKLAHMAADSGMDGVVCSAQEAPELRMQLGDSFQLVTPGIRPAGSAADDQHRTMTPAAALQAGSHYLVIGRPITQAADPLAALTAINQSLQV
ncbi:MAG TPA: orotidine-5'-phosphate decarboxylase [Methylophaga sp.]|nr:orotidine-5'-phosphate decarboxylase [Methylophaga sp.]